MQAGVFMYQLSSEVSLWKSPCTSALQTFMAPCRRWSTGPHLHFEAEPLHLLDVLESPSAEQLKSMEQSPQWRQRSVEASR